MKTIKVKKKNNQCSEILILEQVGDFEFSKGSLKLTWLHNKDVFSLTSALAINLMKKGTLYFYSKNGVQRGGGTYVLHIPKCQKYPSPYYTFK